MKIKNIKWKWVGVAFLLGVVGWIAVRYQASNSEALQFVRDKVKASSAIESRIGAVKDVRLSFPGKYEAYYSTLGTTVEMDVEAVGSKGRIEIDVEVAKDNDVWRIKRSKIGEESILLE